MIEIQNEKGQFLNLYKDSVIETELNSWLLSGEELLGSFSVPFRFPIRGNESFLFHKHRPEAGGFTGIKVSVAIDGLPLGAGNLTFKVSDEQADGILNFNASDVASKLRSKYIHDAVFEDSFTLCSTHTELPDAMFRTVDPLSNPWPFVFFPVMNEDFCDPKYEALNYQHRNYINAYVHFPTSRFQPDSIGEIGSPVVPFFYFTYIIQRVCDFLGYRAEGAWLTHPDIRALVMYNEVAMDTSGLFYSFTVFARFHVWQMKLNEFFKLLRDEMGVGVFFEATRNTITFKPFIEIVQADIVHDLSEDLLKGYVSDPVEQTGLTIEFARDSGDGYAKELPSIPQYVIGLGENSLTMSLTTLPMVSVEQGGVLDKIADLVGKPAGRWFVPAARRRGTSLDFGYNEMGIYDVSFPPKSASVPKLLSYHGMRKDTANRLYPFATSLSRDAKQNAAGTMSLMPDEPDSLFHRYVRPYQEFKAFSKKVTLKFKLKLSTLAKIKLWEKVTVGTADIVALPYLISRLTYALPDIKGRVIAEMILQPFLPPSDDYIPKIPTANVWVRVEFTELDTGGLYPATVGLYTVKFKLYNSREALQSTTSPQPITIFYRFITRGYNTNDDSHFEKTTFETLVVDPGQKEGMLVFPLAMWKSDDKQFQVGLPNQDFVVRSSFIVLPGAGYLII